MTLHMWASAVKGALDVLYQCKSVLTQGKIAGHHFHFTDSRARPPSRTLIDPLAAFTIALQSPSLDVFSHAVDQARQAAEQTKNLEARAGRGAYVNQKVLAESGVPDPGAWGVWTTLNALLSEK